MEALDLDFKSPNDDASVKIMARWWRLIDGDYVQSQSDLTYDDYVKLSVEGVTDEEKLQIKKDVHRAHGRCAYCYFQVSRY